MQQDSRQVASRDNSTSFLSVLSADWLWIVGIIFLAIAIRLDFQIANNFVIDADEAIVGLMAKHILEGAALPTFYYGQHYMGSFEAIVAAGYRYLFGGSSASLKAVPITFSLIFVVLTYWAGYLAAGRFAGRLSSLFCAVAAAPLIVWSAKARGGFIEVICLGAIAFILTHCAINAPERYRARSLFWIGLFLGFGWWVNNQIIFFMLPVGLVCIHFFCTQAIFQGIRLKRMGLGLLSGLSGFFVGGSPFWIYNLKNEFVSFSQFHGPGTTSLTENLTGFFSTALPILLGGKRFWQTQDLFPFSGLIALLVFVSMFLGVIWYRRKECLALITFRQASIGIIELSLLLLVSCALIFSASSFGYLYTAPRYLLPMYVGLFPLFGFVIYRLWCDKKVFAVALFIAVLSLHLSSSYLGGRALPGEPFVFRGERVSKDHSQLIEWLNRNSISWVRTNYWIGYRLAFETEERTRFVIFREPHEQRVPAYRAKAAEIGPFDFPYVLTPGQADVMRRALGVSGVSFQEERLSNYVVLFDFKRLNPDLSPIDLTGGRATAIASHQVTDAHLAIDGDLDSRWGSGAPRNPEMFYEISLMEPTAVGGIRIETGRWCHDAADDLEISVTTRRGRQRQIMSNRDYQALKFMYEKPCDFKLRFAPLMVKRISLNHTGSHPAMDWSLAEVTVYR